ncbi:MAG: class I SAM-dependent methyltransferase [Xanthobacteraceae bacterium]|nr:class I SAM-dependent methyltransferase [Xanthobacteraceae bacterium]
MLEAKTPPPLDEEIDPLTRLAIKHGTDKWGLHFYTPIYHSFFRVMRRQPVRLLEIGIGGYNLQSVGGASLSMWAEYFPDGRIVGIDVADKRLELDPRIEVRRGSQDDPEFLTRVCDELGPFDIVIDDGSHVPQHVTSSFNVLFPRLRNGGLYIVEDVQTTFWPQFGGSTLGGATMRLAMAILEGLHHAEIKVAQPTRHTDEISTSIRAFHAFHNVFLIEKGDNTEPSNHGFRLDNPHAARALRLIETEMNQRPTAAGAANMIQVQAVAGHLTQAWAMLDAALQKWPDHPMLLYAGYNTALVGNDQPRKREFLQALAALEPGNDWLRDLLQQMETEAAEPVA